MVEVVALTGTIARWPNIDAHGQEGMADDSLQTEIAARIDPICQRFEAACKLGKSPSVDDFLAEAIEPDRELLRQELRRLDRAYRERQHGTAESRGLRSTTVDVTPPKAGGPVRATAQCSLFDDRYDIFEEVAQGGMGTVVRAHDRKLDRQVALKFLLPGMSTDRFLREAKLLARVSSPHVVAVFDVTTLDDGRPVIAMEWIDGADLASVIESRASQLSETTALKWMLEVCDGMLAAASLGIVHRDLKPSNILIDRAGRARVADFGLAFEAAGSRLSVSGELMGTPHYMAPEQADDPKTADTRSDLYSFGATFYHALTGTPPFQGETAFSVLYKHKTEPLVPPTARNRSLSSRTGEILERCLAKMPGDRFTDFGELRSQLESRGVGSPWDDPSDRGLDSYLEQFHRRRELYLNDPESLRLPDCYSFPGQRRLEIVHGDLVEQEVDAVVSSDTAYLTQDYGVSLAIASRGGRRVVEEAKRYGRVRPGRAVITSGGKLAARFVLHGVTISQDTLPSRDLISEIMRSCFYHADTLNLQSIAFPLLGTGGAGFSKSVCLDTMFRCAARTLLHSPTALRVIRIVLFS
jgi:eukaryotic-like serine/threonine-protein kinase